MLRLLGDNGKLNDNMLMHVLSPYQAHRSALTDCETRRAQAPRAKAGHRLQRTAAGKAADT
jgi:hypothetical protein